MRTDAELQVDVMDALKWRHSLDATPGNPTVRNAVVTLTGHVATCACKLLADEIVAPRRPRHEALLSTVQVN
jgi:osmotically-inducible protein OsmY